MGLAKLLRSISGKPVTSQTDILKVLDKQGFGKIAAAAGRLRLADQTFDVFHEAFIQTEPPLPVSVQVLDFPNAAEKVIPSWVSPGASSFLSVAWNAKDAFWKVKSIVDDIAGQEGVFDSVIDGIQTDPLGPQIDIKNQVLPFITSQIFAINEVTQPITIDSRRSLIAIRVQDPNGKLAAVLDRAMKNEPDATPEDFQSYRIWKVTRQDDSQESLKFDNDFGSFGKKGSKSSTRKNEEEEEDEPLLSNWAITIISAKSDAGENEQYLMFASHAEMIKEAIQASEKPGARGLLQNESDVDRATKQLWQNQPTTTPAFGK